mgnify:CR=1 FL=1
MKKYNIFLVVITLILFFTLNLSAAEVDIGGEVEVLNYLNIDDEGLEQISITELLNLNIYLPESKNSKTAIEVNIFHNQAGVSAEMKKLYLKRYFPRFNISLGRQPISWSFGSLINPSDFNLGAEIMDISTNGKYLDGANIYIPINWNSGMEIAAVPVGGDKIKYGIRGRTTINNYDISANYVYSPLNNNKKRLAMTLKGDIGPLGAYSSISYEPTENKDEYVYLAGIDYSMAVNYSQNIYFQGEVINLKKEKLNSLMGKFVTYNESEDYNLPHIFLEKERLSFLFANISYSPSNFSQLSLLIAASLDDGSIIITPRYKNQISSNLNLEISSPLVRGNTDDIFNNENILLNMSLSYPF